MNVRFEYLYRDAGNFKSWGEVVFANPRNISADRVAAIAEKALRIDGLYFGFFINSTVNFSTMFENLVFQTDGRHHERHHSVRTPSWPEIALVGEIG